MIFLKVIALIALVAVASVSAVPYGGHYGMFNALGGGIFHNPLLYSGMYGAGMAGFPYMNGGMYGGMYGGMLGGMYGKYGGYPSYGYPLGYAGKGYGLY